MFIQETLIFQQRGASSFLGICSPNKENIISRYFSLFNHKATNSELFWLNEEISPFCGYVLTTLPQLEYGLINSALFYILNKDPLKYKGIKGGALNEAKKLANEVLSKIEFNNNFINPKPIDNFIEFSCKFFKENESYQE